MIKLNIRIKLMLKLKTKEREVNNEQFIRKKSGNK